MKKKVLVIAAHPDDELLGVGGTLRVHKDSDDSIFALILGQGALSREGAENDDKNALQIQARAAGVVIGFSEMFFCDYPDNAFDTVALLSLTKEVEAYIAKIKPDVIYTHHEYDLNIDHRLTFQSVLTACRPCNDNAPAELYTFETLSATEWQSKDHKQFIPTTYVNIEDTLATKIKALSEYKSEMRPYPHSRSLEGVRILAEYRGLEAGLKAAEAFHLVREIKRGKK